MVQTIKNYLIAYLAEQNDKDGWDLLLNLLLYGYNSMMHTIIIAVVVIFSLNS